MKDLHNYIEQDVPSLKGQVDQLEKNREGQEEKIEKNMGDVIEDLYA